MDRHEYKVMSEYHEEVLNPTSLGETDIIALSEKTYHVISSGQSIKSEILHFDKSSKSVTVSVNGNAYRINIQDSYDALIESMGLNAVNDQKLGDIMAPMPGLVVDVLVGEGDTISKGDGILILEAMKMENVLKASGDGVIKKVSITKGDTVDKGQLLIEVE